jgi:type II secretory pathway component PulF
MSRNSILKRKWSRKELILFLEQLSLYISSGLPLNKALGIISESNTRRTKEIAHIQELIERGHSFSSACERYMSSVQAVNALIHQGELSGELASALNLSRELLERSDELTKKCLSALAYPLVIGVFALLLTVGLVRGVMPQIIPLLLSLHIKLPLLTRLTIFVSGVLISQGIFILCGVFIASMAYMYAYKQYTAFRSLIHICVLRIPLMGDLVHSYWLSLFLRSYGSLLGSGVASPQAYSSAIVGVSLLPFRTYLQHYLPYVFDGARLARVFSGDHRIPPYVPALISAGESSGNLSGSLLRAADLVDGDLSHMLKRLTSLIEPVMMAGMGCIVGAIALSIMMPIYDISKVLQR